MRFDKKWIAGIVTATTTVYALYRWRTGGDSETESEAESADGNAPQPVV